MGGNVHQDRAIAGVLDETARAMEASAGAPRGEVMQAVLGSGLSDEAYTALTAMVEAPGGEEAIRAVIRRAAARLLWDLAIVADEEREVGGAPAVIHGRQGEFGRGGRGHPCTWSERAWSESSLIASTSRSRRK